MKKFLLGMLATAGLVLAFACIFSPMTGWYVIGCWAGLCVAVGSVIYAI